MSTPPEPSPKVSAAKTSPVVHWMLGLVVVILAGWALKAMSAVAVPVVFAAFIALAIYPLERRIADALPSRLKWLGRVAVMIVFLLILALFTSAVAFAAQRLLDSLPDLSQKIGEWLSRSGLEASAANGQNGQTSSEGTAAGANALFQDLAGALRDSIGALGNWAVDVTSSFAQTFVAATGGLVAALIVVFFLVLLGLGEGGLWQRKLAAICSGSSNAALQDAIATTADRVRKFVLVRAGVGVLTAAAYAGWLAIFGLDLLLVWAVLALCLTFIPNLGSIISGTLPFFYALLTLDLGTALIVGAGLFVIEQIIGNFVDPRLQGRELVLSPVVILLALLFWGWLWGVAGALLAVPMTIAILAIFNHVPALRGIALLLSNQPAPDDLDRALAD